VFEKFMIMTRGFKNVSQDGGTSGFQLRVRHCAYQGIFLSMISDFEVTIDSETFSGSQIFFTTGNRTQRVDQLWQLTEVYWPWSYPATLTVTKPGGLKPGLHDVRVVERDRTAPAVVSSNAPPAASAAARIAGAGVRKKMTLVA
jgi:hypothetical protein